MPVAAAIEGGAFVVAAQTQTGPRSYPSAWSLFVLGWAGSESLLYHGKLLARAGAGA